MVRRQLTRRSNPNPNPFPLPCARSQRGRYRSETFPFRPLRGKFRRTERPLAAPLGLGIPPPPSSGGHGDGGDGDGARRGHGAVLRAEPAAGRRGRLRRRRRRRRGGEAAEGARASAPGAAAGDVDRGGGHARGDAAVHLLGDARQVAHRGPRLRDQIPHAPTGEGSG